MVLNLRGLVQFSMVGFVILLELKVGNYEEWREWDT